MKELFKKYQKDLLWLANTEAGRFLLGAEKNDKIVKIFSNGYSKLLGFENNKVVLQATFFTWDKIAFNFSPLLGKLDNRVREKREADRLAEYLMDERYFRENYSRSKRFLTGTFYPPSNGSGTLAYRDADDWATARGATSATEAISHGATLTVIYIEKTATPKYYIYRSAYPFLTGDTLVGGTVTAGTFSLYGTTGFGNPFTDSLVLAASTQTDPTALAQADYDNLTLNSPTELASRFALSSWSQSAYNDLALNASGIAGVNVTVGGYTKYVIRSAKDVDNSAPATNETGFCAAFDVGETGTTKDPKLVVTYTLPGGIKSDYSLFL